MLSTFAGFFDPSVGTTKEQLQMAVEVGHFNSHSLEIKFFLFPNFSLQSSNNA
jgi:hypothetical protein